MLVDKVFKPQIGRSIEVYVDGMVIKSRNDDSFLEDIKTTFENLRTVNMKLNPKKKSFLEQRKTSI